MNLKGTISGTEGILKLYIIINEYVLNMQTVRMVDMTMSWWTLQQTTSYV